MNFDYELKEARKGICKLLSHSAVCAVVIAIALVRAWEFLALSDFVMSGVMLGCTFVPVWLLVDSLGRICVIRRLANELKALVERDKE